MPNAPARIRPEVVPAFTERERHAVAARRQVEDGLLVRTLRAHYDREAAVIDAEAAASATTFMIESELDVLAFGIAKANGSAAAAKLVSDRLEQLSRIDSQIMRRFGA